MKRLRIGMQGVILGVLPFRVTPLVRNLTDKEVDHAQWVQTVLHGANCSYKGFLRGTWFVDIEDV